MKPLQIFAALFAACLVALASTFAAEAKGSSPAGTWKWTVQGRQGNGFEQTLRLEYKDGQLTGTMMGLQGTQFSLPDTPIHDATFSDGVIKFSVTREFRGNKVTTKYEGKLADGTIHGTSIRPAPGSGDMVTIEWNAKRVADAAAK
jgi:hypothetical protein